MSAHDVHIGFKTRRMISRMSLVPVISAVRALLDDHSINRVCLHMMVHIGCLACASVSAVRVVALSVSSHHSINRVCLHMMVHIGCKTRRMISGMSLVPVSVP